MAITAKKYRADYELKLELKGGRKSARAVKDIAKGIKDLEKVLARLEASNKRYFNIQRDAFKASNTLVKENLKLKQKEIELEKKKQDAIVANTRKNQSNATNRAKVSISDNDLAKVKSNNAQKNKALKAQEQKSLNDIKKIQEQRISSEKETDNKIRRDRRKYFIDSLRDRRKHNQKLIEEDKKLQNKLTAQANQATLRQQAKANKTSTTPSGDRTEGLFHTVRRASVTIPTFLGIYHALNLVTGAIGSSVQQVLLFDNTMRTLSAVTSATTNETTKLTKEVFALGEAYGGTLQDLATTSQELARAGIKVNELASATSVTARLSLITGDTIQSSASAIISYSQVYQNSAGKMIYTTEQLGDKLAFMANQSRLTTQDIGTLSNFALASTKSVGLTIDQVNGLAISFSNAGNNASTIGTQIRRFTNTLSSNTSSVKEFYKVINVNRTGLLNELGKSKNGDIDGIDKSNKAFIKFVRQVQSLSENEYRNAIQGMNILDNQFFNQLRNNGDEVIDALKTSFNDLNGELDKTGIIADGLGKRAEILWNRFLNIDTGALDYLGDKLLDIGEFIADTSSNISFQGLPQIKQDTDGIAQSLGINNEKTKEVNREFKKLVNRLQDIKTEAEGLKDITNTDLAKVTAQRITVEANLIKLQEKSLIAQRKREKLSFEDLQRIKQLTLQTEQLKKVEDLYTKSIGKSSAEVSALVSIQEETNKNNLEKLSEKLKKEKELHELQVKRLKLAVLVDKLNSTKANGGSKKLIKYTNDEASRLVKSSPDIFSGVKEDDVASAVKYAKELGVIVKLDKSRLTTYANLKSLQKDEVQGVLAYAKVIKKISGSLTDNIYQDFTKNVNGLLVRQISTLSKFINGINDTTIEGLRTNSRKATKLLLDAQTDFGKGNTSDGIDKALQSQALLLGLQAKVQTRIVELNKEDKVLNKQKVADLQVYKEEITNLLAGYTAINQISNASLVTQKGVAKNSTRALTEQLKVQKELNKQATLYAQLNLDRNKLEDKTKDIDNRILNTTLEIDGQKKLLKTYQEQGVKQSVILSVENNILSLQNKVKTLGDKRLDTLDKIHKISEIINRSNDNNSIITEALTKGWFKYSTQLEKSSNQLKLIKEQIKGLEKQKVSLTSDSNYGSDLKAQKEVVTITSKINSLTIKSQDIESKRSILLKKQNRAFNKSLQDAKLYNLEITKGLFGYTSQLDKLENKLKRIRLEKDNAIDNANKLVAITNKGTASGNRDFTIENETNQALNKANKLRTKEQELLAKIVELKLKIKNTKVSKELKNNVALTIAKRNADLGILDASNKVLRIEREIQKAYNTKSTITRELFKLSKEDNKLTKVKETRAKLEIAKLKSIAKINELKGKKAKAQADLDLKNSKAQAKLEKELNKAKLSTIRYQTELNALGLKNLNHSKSTTTKLLELEQKKKDIIAEQTTLKLELIKLEKLDSGFKDKQKAIRKNTLEQAKNLIELTDANAKIEKEKISIRKKELSDAITLNNLRTNGLVIQTKIDALNGSGINRSEVLKLEIEGLKKVKDERQALLVQLTDGLGLSNDNKEVIKATNDVKQTTLDILTKENSLLSEQNRVIETNINRHHSLVNASLNLKKQLALNKLDTGVSDVVVNASFRIEKAKSAFKKASEELKAFQKELESHNNKGTVTNREEDATKLAELTTKKLKAFKEIEIATDKKAIVVVEDKIKKQQILNDKLKDQNKLETLRKDIASGGTVDVTRLKTLRKQEASLKRQITAQRELVKSIKDNKVVTSSTFLNEKQDGKQRGATIKLEKLKLDLANKKANIEKELIRLSKKKNSSNSKARAKELSDFRLLIALKKAENQRELLQAKKNAGVNGLSKEELKNLNIKFKNQEISLQKQLVVLINKQRKSSKDITNSKKLRIELIKEGNKTIQKQIELTKLLKTGWDDIVASLKNNSISILGDLTKGIVTGTAEDVGASLIDSGLGALKSNPDTAVIGYALDIVKSSLGESLSEAELKIAEGRIDFTDDSLNKLGSILDNVNNPLLPYTRQMAKNLASIDAKTFNVVRGLGDSGLDITGKEFNKPRGRNGALNSSDYKGLALQIFDLEGFGTAMAKLFGSSSAKVQGSGIRFDNVGLSGDTTGTAFQNVREINTLLSIKTKDEIKHYTEALSEKANDDINDILKSAGDNLIASGKALGYDDIESKLKKAFEDMPDDIRKSLNSVNLKGLTDVEQVERLKKWLSEVATFGAKNLGDLTDLGLKYKKADETLSASITKIGVQFEQLNPQLEAIGYKGAGSINSVLDLANAFNGDKLQENINAFRTNILDDGSQIALSIKEFYNKLDNLGIKTLPKTKEGFKALSETLDGDVYTSFIGLSKEFTVMVDSIKSAYKERKDLEDKLKESSIKSMQDISNLWLGNLSYLSKAQKTQYATDYLARVKDLNDTKAILNAKEQLAKEQGGTLSYSERLSIIGTSSDPKLILDATTKLAQATLQSSATKEEYIPIFNQLVRAQENVKNDATRQDIVDKLSEVGDKIDKLELAQTEAVRIS